jgi:ABC-type Fe3+ transport system permease subunit
MVWGFSAVSIVCAVLWLTFRISLHPRQMAAVEERERERERKLWGLKIALVMMIMMMMMMMMIIE